VSLLTVSPYAKVNNFVPAVSKIKCARHYVLKPGGQPYVLEPNPMFANIAKFLGKSGLKEFKINAYRRKKDKNGQWVQNFADYWQPPITPFMAREKWYSPWHPICQKCKRCTTK
jgi:hypothetical protein